MYTGVAQTMRCGVTSVSPSSHETGKSFCSTTLQRKGKYTKLPIINLRIKEK